MLVNLKLPDSLFEIALYVTNAAACYLIWVFLHFTATQLYIQYCVGTTFLHMIYSMFYVPSPHCQAISWVIYHGSKNIAAMWYILGTYLSSCLIKNLCFPTSSKAENDTSSSSTVNKRV
jgi:hypothetical protein